MADIVLTTANGTERRWPEPDELTYGELRMMKTLAGVEPAGLPDALKAADAATIMVLAIIAAGRAGETLTMDELDALPFGAITLAVGDDENRPTEQAADAPDALPAATPDNGGNQS